MKILHIATYDQGGAANSCLRLHNGLLKIGIDSQLLVLVKTSDKKAVVSYRDSSSLLENLSIRIRSKLRAQKERRRKELLNRAEDYELFSFPDSPFRVEHHPLVAAADIVNLHWVSGFINHQTFFRKVKKPIVWTMHDMNPFSGWNHYQDDWDRNSHLFPDIDDQIREVKRSAFTHASLHAVSPSHWLAQRAKSSKLFSNVPLEIIPGGLDTDIYTPHDRTAVREQYGLPLNSRVVLFVSASLHTKRKGASLLLEALRMLSDEDLTLCTLGGGKLQEELTDIDLPTVSIGYTQDSTEIAKLYSAADLFIAPSLEDNLPNTVLESLACGTPAIAFDIGGMPDMITDQENGFLAKEISPAALAETIQRALRSDLEKISTQARSSSEKRYHKTIQAERYRELYSKLLSP